MNRAKRPDTDRHGRTPTDTRAGSLAHCTACSGLGLWRTGPPRRIKIGLSAAGGRGLGSGRLPKGLGLGGPPTPMILVCIGVYWCVLVCIGVYWCVLV